jgi:hypothetical protein
MDSRSEILIQPLLPPVTPLPIKFNREKSLMTKPKQRSPHRDTQAYEVVAAVWCRIGKSRLTGRHRKAL